MQSNDSTTQKTPSNSQTSIKAFGVEFSGPSWVALVILFVAIIAGIVYLSETSGADEATNQSEVASFPDENATTDGVTDEAATTTDNSTNDAATTSGVLDEDKPRN
jgi:hypothetical protein